MYLAKTPWIVKKMYPNFLWNINTKDKVLYLTFDDGPNANVTPLALDLLAKYNAKATFFCIGKNAENYPNVYQQVLDAGHKVGNHTHNHLNGFATKDNEYLSNIQQATKVIDTQLFRPPYGRITRFQAKLLSQSSMKFTIVMWDVLSGDFDPKITKQRCANNVVLNAKNGSIVVFHDSDKAKENMLFALETTLKTFANKGFTFEVLP
jgi:peptidoglycan-N-acetylglucosamine deacetylase